MRTIGNFVRLDFNAIFFILRRVIIDLVFYQGIIDLVWGAVLVLVMASLFGVVIFARTLWNIGHSW